MNPINGLSSKTQKSNQKQLSVNTITQLATKNTIFGAN